MLIILCWKLFTTKTSEIFLLSGEHSHSKKSDSLIFFFFLKKDNKTEYLEKSLNISDEMGKGYRKRRLEIVFFSGASPLIHSHLILPEVTCLKLNLLLCCHFDDRPFIYIDQVLLGFC